MALDQINQAVLDAARTDADLILKAAQKAVDDKLSAARKAADQEAERRYQAAARALEEDLARKVIQLQGASNKEMLLRKNALLQKIFVQARDRILALPAGEYAAVMGKLLGQTVEDRGGRLRVHPEDKATFQALLSTFNQGRAEALQVRIDDAEPLAERGGFIFVSEAFQVDQTLGTLLSDIEHELAPQIAADLFSVQK